MAGKPARRFPMRSLQLLFICLLLLTASVCLAGIPASFFTIHGKDAGMARVDDGKLTLGASSINKVPDRQEAPDKWYVGGTQIKSSTSGSYLAYDTTGKDPKVFLAPRPGDGTE